LLEAAGVQHVGDPQEVFWRSDPRRRSGETRSANQALTTQVDELEADLAAARAALRQMIKETSVGTKNN